MFRQPLQWPRVLSTTVFVGASLLFSTAYSQGPIADPITKGTIRIELKQVASNLTAPTHLTALRDGSNRNFVADQSGSIFLYDSGTQSTTNYLDLSSLLVPLGGIIPPFQDPFADYDERGLLGVTFHPEFANTGSGGFGKFYTYTSETLNGAADFTVSLPVGEVHDHQSVVREWTVDPNANNVQGATSREVMRVDQPQFNHNGGALEFGADNQLYVAFGDGGAARDNGSGHSVDGNGQDGTNILGSIARIDPLGNNSANGSYGIPGDNPFVGSSELDEIYSFGFRNPFRMSFDQTGRLIVADVGQNNIEEVDIVSSGDNHGWRFKEGSFYYDPINNVVSETPIAGITPDDFVSVDPVLEYDHDEGISIIGGFLYEGTEIPDLIGKYVFGDFSRQFFTPDGRLFYGDLDTGEINELIIGIDDRNLDLFVKGFGQDADGELYLLAGTNLGPFRDTNDVGYGGIWKITAVPEPSSGLVLALLGLVVISRKRRES